MCIGWHSDDESQLAKYADDNTVGIYSFSYGATRRFDLRLKKKYQLIQDAAVASSKAPKTRKKGAPSDGLQLYVANNTCAFMGGLTQVFFDHQVPTEARVMRRRINITFRLFKDTFMEQVEATSRVVVEVKKNWLMNLLFPVALFGLIRDYISCASRMLLL